MSNTIRRLRRNVAAWASFPAASRKFVAYRISIGWRPNLKFVCNSQILLRQRERRVWIGKCYRVGKEKIDKWQMKRRNAPTPRACVFQRMAASFAAPTAVTRAVMRWNSRAIAATPAADFRSRPIPVAHLHVRHVK